MATYTFVVTGYKDGSDNVAWEYTFNTATETLSATGNTWGIPRATTAACLGGERRSDGAYLLIDYVGASDARIYKVDSDLSGEDGTWAGGTGYIAFNEIGYHIALDGSDNFLIAHTTDAGSDIVTHYSADGTTENWDYGVMDQGYGVGFDTTNNLAYWSGKDVGASLVNYANASNGGSVTSIFATAGGATSYCRGLYVDNINGKVYIAYSDGNVGNRVAQYPVNSSTADWTTASNVNPGLCVGRCGDYVVASGVPGGASLSFDTYLSSDGTLTDSYQIDNSVTDLLVLDSEYVVVVGNHGADEEGVGNTGNVRVLKLSSGNISQADIANVGGASLNMGGVISGPIGTSVDLSGEATITLSATGTLDTYTAVDLSGEATITLSATGTLDTSTAVDLSGEATITLSATGTLLISNFPTSVISQMGLSPRLVCIANNILYYEDV